MIMRTAKIEFSSMNSRDYASHTYQQLCNLPNSDLLQAQVVSELNGWLLGLGDCEIEGDAQEVLV